MYSFVNVQMQRFYEAVNVVVKDVLEHYKSTKTCKVKSIYDEIKDLQSRKATMPIQEYFNQLEILMTKQQLSLEAVNWDLTDNNQENDQNVDGNDGDIE